MNELAANVSKPYMLYMLLELIVFLVPIGGLIWKAAKQAGKIDDMEKGFSELKKRVEENEKQSQRDISEIKSSITAINVSNAEILTSLKFITDSIVELKKKGN